MKNVPPEEKMHTDREGAAPRVTGLHPLVATRLRADGGTTFAPVPRTIWSTFAPPDEDNCIPVIAASLLIEWSDGRRALVDTGCGPAHLHPEKLRHAHGIAPGWDLENALAEYGLAPENINLVILTHLHWDHAGGVALALQRFPAATLVVHSREWNAAVSGNPLFAKSYPAEIIASLLKLPKERRHLPQGKNPAIAPGVSLMLTGGHSPGHCAVLVSGPQRLSAGGASLLSARGGVLFAGDILPTRHHLRIGYYTAYDHYPIHVRGWKMHNLPRLAGNGTAFLFGHDADVFAATIKPDPRRDFLPEKTLPVPAPPSTTAASHPD